MHWNSEQNKFEQINITKAVFDNLELAVDNNSDSITAI
jgi:hypothetical protein